MKLNGKDVIVEPARTLSTLLVFITEPTGVGFAFPVVQNMLGWFREAQGRCVFNNGFTITHPTPNMVRLTIPNSDILTGTVPEFRALADALEAIPAPPPIHRHGFDSAFNEQQSQHDFLGAYMNTPENRVLIQTTWPTVRDIVEPGTIRRGNQWIYVIRNRRNNAISAFYTGTIHLF